MLEVKYSSKFHKDYKLIKKRGYKIEKLRKVIDLLRKNEPLPK